MVQHSMSSWGRKAVTTSVEIAIAFMKSVVSRKPDTMMDLLTYVYKIKDDVRRRHVINRRNMRGEKLVELFSETSTPYRWLICPEEAHPSIMQHCIFDGACDSVMIYVSDIDVLVIVAHFPKIRSSTSLY